VKKIPTEMRVAFTQNDLNNVEESSNFMGAFSLINNRSIMTDQPTCNDIMLGRGVATNRHPGNSNFRAIVSQHVVSKFY